MLSTLWSYLPNFDGQTVVSLVVGSTLTLATFWFAYKKTLGAQDERARAASQELILSVQKRVAVERVLITAMQFEEIRRAKSLRTSVPVIRLFDFADVLACVLADVVDNGFLESSGKSEIIALLEQSKQSVRAEGSALPRLELERFRQRQRTLASLAAVASTVGVAGGLLSFLFPLTDPNKAGQSFRDFLRFASQTDLIVFSSVIGVTLLAITTSMISYITSKDRLRADNYRVYLGKSEKTSNE